MPVRLKMTFLGAALLLLAAAGCKPTSESAQLSALSHSYSASATPLSDGAQDSPTIDFSPTPLPAPVFPPTSTPQPTPATCQENKGAVIHEQIESTYVKSPLKFRLYLPPCYNEAAEKPYPLLILLHGSIFTDDQWDRLGMDETADRLISAGEISPLMILMPYEEQTLANPYQAGFGLALTEELMPWLENHYPVCRERACRAIGGISRGASWAVHLGFNNWKLFASIGTHSLPPFWGDLNVLPLWLSAIPADEHPRVFVDVGQSDPYRQPASQFEQFLTDYHIEHEWYLYTGGHDETYWSAHIEQYLRWYSAGWPPD